MLRSGHGGFKDMDVDVYGKVPIGAISQCASTPSKTYALLCLRRKNKDTLSQGCENRHSGSLPLYIVWYVLQWTLPHEAIRLLLGIALPRLYS